MPGYTRDDLEPMVDAGGLVVRGQIVGDHFIDFMSLPIGDYEGLLAGLADGCEAIHCGYLIKGRMVFRYADGSQEEFAPGHAFYVPPGHHFEVLEAAEVVGFTVMDDDFARMQQTIAKNLESFLQAR